MAQSPSPPGGKSAFDPYRFLAENPQVAAMIGRGQTTAYQAWDAAGRPVAQPPQPAFPPQPGKPAGAQPGSMPAMAPAPAPAMATLADPAQAMAWLESAAAAAGKARPRRGGGAGLLAPARPKASGAAFGGFGAGARRSALSTLLLGSEAP